MDDTVLKPLPVVKVDIAACAAVAPQKAELIWVPIAKLVVDTRYQRDMTTSGQAHVERIAMVSEHPAFAFKLTLTTRIRWINLHQKRNGPMGNHAWFVWDFNIRRRNEMRDRGMLRAV